MLYNKVDYNNNDINIGHIRSIWKHRFFIFGIVKRDFQSRYLNSLIGAGWAIINPLAMLIIYTVIFSQVLQSRLPGMVSTYGYSIYLYTGLVMWGLFSEILTNDSRIFLDHADIIKKVNFPRVCLPIIVIACSLISFFIQLVLFVGFLIVVDRFPGAAIINILPFIIIVIILSSGIGIFLGVINVFYRDISEVTGILIQFWFWLTPIVYPTTIVPVWAMDVISLNPMTSIIQQCQNIVLTGISQDWAQIIPILIIACSFNVLALIVYKHFAAEIVDEL